MMVRSTPEASALPFPVYWENIVFLAVTHLAGIFAIVYAACLYFSFWTVGLSVLWLIVWILARPVVASVEVPVLGPVPMPFAALVASVVAGYLLARAVGLHAGWLGRRWARRLRSQVSAAVERELVDRGLEGLERLEVAHRALWMAAVGAIKNCRPS